METWCWAEWKGNWYPVHNVTNLPQTRGGGKRCRVEYVAPAGAPLQYDIVPKGDLVDWQEGLDQRFDITRNRDVLQALAMRQEASQVRVTKKRRGLRKIVDRPDRDGEASETGDSENVEWKGDDSLVESVASAASVADHPTDAESTSCAWEPGHYVIRDFLSGKGQPAAVFRHIEGLIETGLVPSNLQSAEGMRMHFFWTKGGKDYRTREIEPVKKRCDACGLRRMITRKVCLTTTCARAHTHAWELGCVCFEKLDLARSMISWLGDNCPEVGPCAAAQWRLLEDRYARVVEASDGMGFSE